MNPTLYDVLGVPRDAGRDEIKKAWREAADRFEPGQGASTAQFRLFNEAAEVLLDPKRRKAYDLTLSDGSPAPAPAAEPVAVPAGVPAAATSTDSSEGAVADPPETAVVAATAPVPGAATATATPGTMDAALPAPEEGADEKGDRAEPASTVEHAPTGTGVPLAVLLVLGLLTAAAVGSAAYFGFGWSRAQAYQESIDRAPAAAERAATAILSYDHESLEADRDAAAKFLTPDYRSEYTETFDMLVQENAETTKASVEAQVLASSAMVQTEGRDPDRVPVLLFVNQTTVSTASQGEPRTALNRVKLDMVKQDGTWLVDDITSY